MIQQSNAGVSRFGANGQAVFNWLQRNCDSQITVADPHRLLAGYITVAGDFNLIVARRQINPSLIGRGRAQQPDLRISRFGANRQPVFGRLQPEGDGQVAITDPH